jgi:hypothetical protein
MNKLNSYIRLDELNSTQEYTVDSLNIFFLYFLLVKYITKAVLNDDTQKYT